MFEAGGFEQGVVRALLEEYGDGVLIDGDVGAGIDEVAEDAPGCCGSVDAAELNAQEAIETAGHEGELQVTVDFHGHGRRECVHVEEVDDYRARWYEAGVGKFTAEEPFPCATTEQNLYAYTANTPTGYTDPFGLAKNPVLDLCGMYYGNWGGPGHSGPGAPIDAMDQCFKQHDVCYLDLGVTSTRCGDPSESKNRCGHDLVWCLDRIGGDPTAWNKPAPDLERARTYWQEARSTFQACQNKAVLEGYNPAGGEASSGP